LFKALSHVDDGRIPMAVQKSVAYPLGCIVVAIALASSPKATGQDALKTIPIDDQPVSTAPVVHEDNSTEDNSRAFNTPTDDGRPGEYYFALGVQAVKKGDYAHAMAMYKVAASWAYKPAEYNLGVMYLSGQGTAVDLPTAMAWMALAAERNDAEYVRAKKLVYAHLTPEQFARANEIWRGLLPTYGDETALPHAKARWREAKVNATGSRVGSSAAHVEVGGADGSPNHMAKPNYDTHSGFNVTKDPGAVAGVHQADGAMAYQQLRATDNPYDPKFAPVSGQVAVGELAPVPKKTGEATVNDTPKATDGTQSGH
jgi:hypothetical protein